MNIDDETLTRMLTYGRSSHQTNRTRCEVALMIWAPTHAPTDITRQSEARALGNQPNGRRFATGPTPRSPRSSNKQKPDPTPARANKRLLPILPAQNTPLSNRQIPLADTEKTGCQMLVVPIQDPDQRTPSRLPPMEEPKEEPLGHRPGRDGEAPAERTAPKCRSYPRMSDAARQC